jgi:hypothetical protein
MGGVMSTMCMLGLKKGKAVMDLFKNYQEPKSENDQPQGKQEAA